MPENWIALRPYRARSRFKRARTIWFHRSGLLACSSLLSRSSPTSCRRRQTPCLCPCCTTGVSRTSSHRARDAQAAREAWSHKRRAQPRALQPYRARSRFQRARAIGLHRFWLLAVLVALGCSRRGPSPLPRKAKFAGWDWPTCVLRAWVCGPRLQTHLPDYKSARPTLPKTHLISTYSGV